MPTSHELQALLMECHNGMLGVSESILGEFIQGITQDILNYTRSHQLPRITPLRQSAAVRQLFQEIMQAQCKETMMNHAIVEENTNLLNELMPHFSKTKLDIKNVPTQQLLETRSDQINQIKKLLLPHTYAGKATFARLADIKRDQVDAYLNNGLTGKDQAFIDSPTEGGTPKFDTFDCAFAWLVKNFHEKNKLLKSSRSLIKQEHLTRLDKISLQLHSEQYSLDAHRGHGPVHVIHFYNGLSSLAEPLRPTSPRISEHLHGYDSEDELDEYTSFCQTSHGLGSAIYALGVLTEKQINASIERKSCFEVYEISIPLRLIDNETAHESEQLTELSKYLQRVGDSLRELRGFGMRTRCTREEEVIRYFTAINNTSDLNNHAEKLSRFKQLKDQSATKEHIYDVLLASMMEWFTIAKKKEQGLIPMPINYVIKKLGFTGIISTVNDQFNRGLVVLEPVIDVASLKLIPVRLTAIKSKSPRHSRLDSPRSTPSAPSSPHEQDRLSCGATDSPCVHDELTMIFNKICQQDRESPINILDDRFPSPSQIFGMGALIRSGSPSMFRYSFFRTSPSAFSVSPSNWQPDHIDVTQALSYDANDGSAPGIGFRF